MKTPTRLPTALTVLLLSALPVGCDRPGSDQVFSIQGTGSLEGQTFVDISRTGELVTGDRDLPGMKVSVVMEGTRDTVANGVSNVDGHLRVEGLIPGTYRVVPDPGLLGDSLAITSVDPPLIQIRSGQTSTFTLGASFPILSIPSVRDAAEGRRVFVEGIALNPPGSLEGDALHITDGTTSLRTLGASGLGARVGDRVRLLGRTQRLDGQMVLTSSLGRSLTQTEEFVEAPSPLEVTAAAAASAGGSGELDAALVRIPEVTVDSARTSFGRITLGVSDGTGTVEVEFGTTLLFDARIERVEIGMVLSFTGVLVPASQGGSWAIHPRVREDIRLIRDAPPPENEEEEEEEEEEVEEGEEGEDEVEEEGEDEGASAPLVPNPS